MWTLKKFPTKYCNEFCKSAFCSFCNRNWEDNQSRIQIKNYHGILPLKFVCIINITNQKYLNERIKCGEHVVSIFVKSIYALLRKSHLSNLMPCVYTTECVCVYLLYCTLSIHDEEMEIDRRTLVSSQDYDVALLMRCKYLKRRLKSTWSSSACRMFF